MDDAAVNPPMLLVGVLLSWLFVRMLRRGTIITRMGAVSRDKSPTIYWIVLGANGLIVAAAFVFGGGLLRP